MFILLHWVFHKKNRFSCFKSEKEGLKDCFITSAQLLNAQSKFRFLDITEMVLNGKPHQSNILQEWEKECRQANERFRSSIPAVSLMHCHGKI